MLLWLKELLLFNPFRRANSRGYRQVKILTDATEVVLGIRKADIFRDFSCLFFCM